MRDAASPLLDGIGVSGKRNRNFPDCTDLCYLVNLHGLIIISFDAYFDNTHERSRCLYTVVRLEQTSPLFREGLLTWFTRNINYDNADRPDKTCSSSEI